MTLFVSIRRAAIALTFALVTIMASQPALAVVPEIVVDPRTGKAVPHHDLEAALVALGTPVTYAETRWRRAPWFAS